MKKNRYFAIGFLLLFAIIASLWLPRRNLRETAQVAGIALDWEQDGLMATFELYQADAEETIGSKKRVVVGYGETLGKCIEDALRRQGKHLFVNDASVLILGQEKKERLLEEVLNYYRNFSHDDMDLPVFFAKGKAADFLNGEGAVRSMEIAASAKALNQRQTVKDLMNQRGERIWLLFKEDGYELEK